MVVVSTELYCWKHPRPLSTHSIQAVGIQMKRLQNCRRHLRGLHLRRNSLAADGVTKNTRQLSAQVDSQQEHASPTPTPQQQQIDQMPGMKMP